MTFIIIILIFISIENIIHQILLKILNITVFQNISLRNINDNIMS